MKKFLITLIMAVLVLSVLVSCVESKNMSNKTKTEEMKVVGEQKDIDDFVTIKEEVNREAVSPNGDRVKYIYEVPIININKPVAQKINEMFLNLEKDQERRIGKHQCLVRFVKSKAFLNDGIISLVMEICKPGPDGIYVVNYDIENDKEINTRELVEKYKFDPQKLIDKINKEVEINENKPKEEQRFIGKIYFIDTIMLNVYDLDSKGYLEETEEIENKTEEEKERYIIDNIDKLKAYINNDGNFVFIHHGCLADEEFVVE